MLENVFKNSKVAKKLTRKWDVAFYYIFFY